MNRTFEYSRQLFKIFSLLAVSAFAADGPAEIQYWSAAALKKVDMEMRAGTRNKGLAVKTISVIGVDPSAISSSVKEFPPNSLLLVDRISTGESEIHTNQNDVMTILEGSATLITGGKLTGERKISDTEIRGESLTGTGKRPVKVGDIILIPAKLPHQLVLKPGEHLTYTVFKAETH
jgi:mannose-6-phosphate isomerase-like protein (cupin superfamily)